MFTTMVIFAIQPGIDFIIEILMIKATKLMKKKDDNHDDYFHTDYLSFLEIYAGPEYVFFYKAAVTNLTMLVCFILGGCMPAFYLIGIVAVAV